MLQAITASHCDVLRGVGWRIEKKRNHEAVVRIFDAGCVKNRAYQLAMASLSDCRNIRILMLCPD